MVLRGATKCYLASDEQERPVAQVAHHTSNIVPERLTKRVWSIKFQYSPLNIHFRPSGFQASFLFIYFRDGPNKCSHCTKVCHKTYTICDNSLSRSARHSFAPSQRPYLIWFNFCCRAKSIRYGVTHRAFIEDKCKGLEVGKEENSFFLFLALTSLAYSPDSSKKQNTGRADSPTWKIKIICEYTSIKEPTNKQANTNGNSMSSEQALSLNCEAHLINKYQNSDDKREIPCYSRG